MAPWRGGIPAFSLESNKKNKNKETDENVFGFTFDSMQNKLYWSSFDKIYRSNSDVTEMGTVLSTSKCDSICMLPKELCAQKCLILDFILTFRQHFTWFGPRLDNRECLRHHMGRTHSCMWLYRIL